MIIKDEKDLVKCLEPIIEVVADATRRVASLEQNTTRSAGDAACDNMVKMCDSFLRGVPIAVSELPHIAPAITVYRAYGKRIEDVLPEVSA